jgi:hypothetical protein
MLSTWITVVLAEASLSIRTLLHMVHVSKKNVLSVLES